MTFTKYTLVQHSGYGYGGKETFKKAVEVMHLDGPRDVALVSKYGGLIYNTYAEARRAEEYLNGIDGKRPFLSVPGTFLAPVKIDGLALYVPPKS